MSNQVDKGKLLFSPLNVAPGPLHPVVSVLIVAHRHAEYFEFSRISRLAFAEFEAFSSEYLGCNQLLISPSRASLDFSISSILTLFFSIASSISTLTKQTI